MHGGFVLYNGGFNAGLAALIIIPILDFYKIKPNNVDSDEVFEIEGHKKGLMPHLISLSEKRTGKK